MKKVNAQKLLDDLAVGAQIVATTAATAGQLAQQQSGQTPTPQTTPNASTDTTVGLGIAQKLGLPAKIFGDPKDSTKGIPTDYVILGVVGFIVWKKMGKKEKTK